MKRFILLFISAVLLDGCCKEDFIIPSTGPTKFRVFVSNAGSHNVSVIDPDSLKEVNVLSCDLICREPRNLAISPDKSMVYVPYRHSNSVSVIDPESLTVIADITHASFSEPYAIAFTADNREAWVVNKQGESISIINTATKSVVATINHVDIYSPEGITIANGKAYVVNRGDGNVPVFNVADRSYITTISTPRSESRFAVATPNGSLVYVGNKTNILKIETTNNSITQTISIPDNSRNLTVSPDGSKVFVATQGQTVYAINVSDNVVTPILFNTASSIYGVAVSSTTNKGFATDESKGVVFVFNALTGMVVKDGLGQPLEINVGSTPRAIAAQ